MRLAAVSPHYANRFLLGFNMKAFSVIGFPVKWFANVKNTFRNCAKKIIIIPLQKKRE